MPDKNDSNAPSPSIGVGGIVFNDNRQVLLIERNQPPASGLWSIPGGKLESKESLSEACNREVKEETGLDVQATVIVAVVERQTEGFHYIIIDYLALLKSPEQSNPIAQSDASNAKWVEIDKLSKYKLVPGLHEIIIRAFDLYYNHQLAGLHDVHHTGTDYILPS
jgi:8-oxo-dGTP diphosphatase